MQENVDYVVKHARIVSAILTKIKKIGIMENVAYVVNHAEPAYVIETILY
jgi:hypothetical protein